MNITIICVGKIKEKFYRDALSEYEKRLSRYCKLNIIEVPDEKTPENASDRENELIKDKEGEAILKHVKENMFAISLEITGTSFSSEGFAKKIENLGLSGESNIAFVIGGSLGLSKKVSKRSDLKLSFSEFTFPHQLMRVILLEQIYRAFKIISGEPYHK